MGRGAIILGSVLILALLAGGLAEVAMVLGRHGSLTDDLTVRPRATATPVASPTPSATPTPTPATPTPTPAATPVPTKTAVTNSFVHMRAGKSTATVILADLNGGTRVEILSDSDAQWQQVRYGGQVGYIFRLYLVY